MKQKSNRPKTVTKTLPIVFTGLDGSGNTYDVESCKNLIRELQDFNVFSKITVNAFINKGFIFDNRSGSFSLARVQSIDIESENAVIALFAKNSEFIDKIEDFVIVPCVRVKRDTGEVTTIFRFEIVPTLEA